MTESLRSDDEDLLFEYNEALTVGNFEKIAQIWLVAEGQPVEHAIKGLNEHAIAMAMPLFQVWVN